MSAFVLEITHPRAARRVELIAPDEAVTLNRRGHIHVGHPVAHSVSSLLITSSRGAPPTIMGLPGARPEINGAVVDASGLANKKELNAGDVVRWQDFVVTVGVTREPDEAEWQMIEAARANDAALLVYADWLESNGEAECAEWARLSLDPTKRRGRMQELANRIGIDFRALVARGPVERCEQSCDRRWEQLTLRNEPWRRSCETCSKMVRWCGEVDAARRLSTGPVVIDPAEPRRELDLVSPRLITIG